MYVDEAREFTKIAAEIDRREKRDLLAIVTNPHLKAEHQRRLFRALEPDDRLEEARERLKRLKEKRDGENHGV